MYGIIKKFDLDYSHRLHLQCEGHKCRNLHGHSGVVEIEIRSETLDEKGFLIEFSDLNFIKAWIDENWDHSLIVSANDEILNSISSALDTKKYVLKENYCQTTSELLAERLYIFVKHKLSLLCYGNRSFKLRISFKETSNNCAYFGDF